MQPHTICGCALPLDPLRFHRASCPHTPQVQVPHVPDQKPSCTGGLPNPRLGPHHIAHQERSAPVSGAPRRAPMPFAPLSLALYSLSLTHTTSHDRPPPNRPPHLVVRACCDARAQQWRSTAGGAPRRRRRPSPWPPCASPRARASAAAWSSACPPPGRAWAPAWWLRRARGSRRRASPQRFGSCPSSAW